MQIQPKVETVQETLEDALCTVLQEKTSITAAGRTDKGVHALQMVAHFDTEKNVENLDYKLNRFLPNSIGIQQIRKVQPNAHARFDALSRTYKYFIHFEKNPFLEEYSFLHFKALDKDAMNQASKILLEYNDFSSFEKLHSDNKTSICNVTYAQWNQQENQLVFTISADRFLRNMVRAIVGTLIEVGLGNIDNSGFRNIIEKKDRKFASTSAAAHGLFLYEVAYPKSVFI